MERRDNMFGAAGVAPSRIFRDKEVFGSDYMPSRILHREQEMSEVSGILEDVFLKTRPANMLVEGEYGTGKTIVVRFIGKELLQEANKRGKPKVAFHYVNCNTTQARYPVIRLILAQGEGRQFSTGYPSDYYSSAFQHYCARHDYVIVVLDEVDKMIFKRWANFDELAYYLTREVPNTSLILLTNDLEVKDYIDKRMDARTKDTLRPRDVSFGEYDATELRDILIDRAPQGFREGVLGDDMIRLIAALSQQNGLRARGLIDIARVAGELAEKDKTSSEARILDRHVQKAADIVIRQKSLRSLSTLDPPCAATLAVLYNEFPNGFAPRELYGCVKQARGLSDNDRMSYHYFFDILQRLEGRGLIVRQRRSKGYGMGVEVQILLNDEFRDLVGHGLKEMEKEGKLVI